MNAAGAIIARLTIPHQPDGFRKLETTRQQLAVTAADCLIGLETAHNLLLDFLWGHSYQQIYVIPPWVVKSSRGRYGHSRARDDTLDAQLLADLLRTDRARLQPWRPDSQLTRQIHLRDLENAGHWAECDSETVGVYDVVDLGDGKIAFQMIEDSCDTCGFTRSYLFTNMKQEWLAEPLDDIAQAPAAE